MLCVISMCGMSALFKNEVGGNQNLRSAHVVIVFTVSSAFGIAFVVANVSIDLN